MDFNKNIKTISLDIVILIAVVTFILSVLASLLIINYETSKIELSEGQSKVVISSSKNKIIINIPDKYKKPDNRKTLYRIEQLDLSPPTEIEDETMGLCYLYFEGAWSNVPNFASLTPIKTGRVDYPHINVANHRDHIAIQFYGYIKIEESGIYSFYTLSDDGSILYIDDKMVVNNDGIHGRKEESGEIALEKGFHSINVDFFENRGGESLSVLYSGPGITKGKVPQHAFYHPATWNCPKEPTRKPNMPKCLNERNSEGFDFQKCIESIQKSVPRVPFLPKHGMPIMIE